MDILKKALISLTETNNSLAIFDIDSTLLNVTKRNEKILHTFADSLLALEDHIELAQKIKTSHTKHNDWGIDRILTEVGLNKNDQIYQEAKLYWRQHFFSNEFLKYDSPYPQAAEYVQEIDRLMTCKLYYLTGRDLPRMHTGTIASLKEHQFPKGDRLHLKPQPKQEDHIYKLQVLESWSQKFSNIWFFENEPVIINRVAKKLPQIKIVALDTVHSGREEIEEFPSIFKVKSFE